MSLKKPDYLVAYRIIEVQNPIRIDKQQGNDEVLTQDDDKTSVVEFTSTVENIRFDIPTKLKDAGTVRKDSLRKGDTDTKIIRVIFPVKPIADSKVAIASMEKEIDNLYAAFDKPDMTDDRIEKIQDRLDELEPQLETAEEELREMCTITLSSDESNIVSVDISDMTSPKKISRYVVLPIEKIVYATECSNFISEGTRLYKNRKYEKARENYINAYNAKDVYVSMKPTIQSYIDDCDSCLVYEQALGHALANLKGLVDNPAATQEEQARYAGSGITFCDILINLNPHELYKDRKERLEKIISDIPLKVIFTCVELRGMEEGSLLPDVELWAYYGKDSATGEERPKTSVLEEVRKTEYKKGLTIGGTGEWALLGITGDNGQVEISVNRARLPKYVYVVPVVQNSEKKASKGKAPGVNKADFNILTYTWHRLLKGATTESYIERTKRLQLLKKTKLKNMF